jgi:hypothetical protein
MDKVKTFYSQIYLSKADKITIQLRPWLYTTSNKIFIDKTATTLSSRKEK